MLQSAEERRQSIDQMMWQVPGLSLAAQSFLLTISLGHSGGAARLVSGLLGLVASLATIQLLLKHRFHELEWSHWLQNVSKLEPTWSVMHDPKQRRRAAWEASSAHATHEWMTYSRPPGSKIPPFLWSARRRLVHRSSVTIWVLALSIFALGDLGAAVYGAVSLFV